ncbi:DUF2325 domain-containing protein [Acidovorax sp. Root219]|uniref:DUF2325 domain-containing protein n=1 Tax=Acidovorax sp. Root219 TaxID=1736493 RepID=UPI000709026F|nr:DUF2325 domain-containing protein [Acidovorax sp. Root219]KRC36344.1 hypothetical protein ASE28_02120 [Acidovorax sp. Root219]
MHSLSEEFMVLSRQLGEAQTRCSAALAEQAAELEQLRAEVVRLRAAVVVRETRLALAHDDLAQLQAAQPGLRRRRDMARHIATLAERIASLSRECLRWRLRAVAAAPEEQCIAPAPAAAVDGTDNPALDFSLAAADLVICQTGCISHDEYWRVQDHCRRTGKPCILMDQPLGAGAVDKAQPVVVLRMARGLRAVSGVQAVETATTPE